MGCDVLNAAREDYLLAIYRLTKEKDHTNSVSIARALGVSRASVSEMVKKLSAEDLIIFSKNRIYLTEIGRKKLGSYFNPSLMGVFSGRAFAFIVRRSS